MTKGPRINIPSRLLGIFNSLDRPTFRCEHSVTDESIELQFTDFVGDWWTGATSSAVGTLLAKNRGKPVNVVINSVGGIAHEGIGIYNLLRDHDGPVTTTVIGDASSAASHILQAGDVRRMKDNTSFMIHRCMVWMAGNAGELRAIAEDCDVMDDQIAHLYAGRAGGSAKEWLSAMAGPKDKDGTTYTAKAAKAAGLIDEILPSGDKSPAAGNQRAAIASGRELVREVLRAAISARLRLLDIDAECANS